MMVWMKNIMGGQIYWQANDEHGYVFVNRNGLSLAEIPSEFVGIAEQYRCGCSDCNSRRQCLVRASAEEIKVWKADG